MAIIVQYKWDGAWYKDKKSGAFESIQSAKDYALEEWKKDWRVVTFEAHFTHEQDKEDCVCQKDCCNKPERQTLCTTPGHNGSLSDRGECIMKLKCIHCKSICNHEKKES